MICNVIATGSTGNAVVLNRLILIDAGVPYKLIEPYVKDLRLVLLTHQHGDHLNLATIRRLHRERPTLRFGCGDWLLRPLLDSGIAAKNIDLYDMCRRYDYGSATVEAFPLIHDVRNCGYKIGINGKSALYATDTGNLDDVSAPGFDLYMIEANHQEAELAERIKRKAEAGEFIYEYRAAATHLSRETADAWLAWNAGPNSKVVYLHQHIEKGEPNEFLR